jgi:hypothetical protein
MLLVRKYQRTIYETYRESTLVPTHYTIQFTLHAIVIYLCTWREAILHRETTLGAARSMVEC